jgi:hypothetical protein
LKKGKIIAIVAVILVIVGLLIFASTHKYEDSHLRLEGVRVRVGENALLVDGCDEETQNVAYCEKTIEVNGEDQKLIFEFKNFKKNGYPETVVASINGHEFYREDGLDIEDNGSIDYKIFLNFQVINDEVIMFTFTDGTNGRSTTLYGIDTEGNIILQESEIDTDEMLIKDYTDFITYEDNKIIIYATRVVEDINYHGESICNASDSDVVEAYYTYTYKKGKFTKKQTEKITAEEFIENKGIICANKK